jgi:hypothetical protein
MSQIRDRYHTALEQIRNNLAVMELAQMELRQQIATFQECHSLAAGSQAETRGISPMWPAIPTSEQATTRNRSDTAYLYLYWSQNCGPIVDNHHQPKTYLGCQPASIDLARRMIANRRQYQELTRADATLQRQIQSHVNGLEQIAQETVWIVTANAHMLEQNRGAGSAPGCPKEATP